MTTRRAVFFLSDSTGITAETMGHSLLAQFSHIEFDRETVPFINSHDKARNVVSLIDMTFRNTGEVPIVFTTIVDEEIASIIADCNGMLIDLVRNFLGPLSDTLGTKPTSTTGGSHSDVNNTDYQRRIDAMNYALTNDDGQTVGNYQKADVILVGASRTGKTPTSLYLALHYGIYAANYPLTDDDLEGWGLPAVLQAFKSKLFGLTIKPDRLSQIRQERRPDSRYASIEQCRYEVQRVEKLYQQERIPYISTTNASVEEIASRIRHSDILHDTVSS